MWRPCPPTFPRLASAIYAIDEDEDAWMRGVMTALRADHEGAPSAFLGMANIPSLHIEPMHVVGTDGELEEHVTTYGAQMPTAYVASRMRHWVSTDRHLLGPSFDGMPCRPFLDERRLDDIFVLASFTRTRRFAAFGAYLPRSPEPLPDALLEEWEQVSMHLRAALELRSELATGDARAEAVFSADGRCLHAEGTGQDARLALRDAIQRVERARSSARDRPTHLEAQRPMVDGRFTLVDQFEADGKHFVVAYARTEESRAEALSSRERRVAELMAEGWAFKRIAYHLGLSEGAVSSYAHRAKKKLGARSRLAIAQALRRG